MDDMFDTPVLLDIHYLLNEIFAFPSHIPAAATVTPELKKSPFSPTLKGADGDTGNEVSAQMVRHSFQ